ncbi:MAG: flavin reductase family protein [Pseudonocardiaceae bacterium]
MSALEKAHRLLAPRIAYLVGTRTSDNSPNLIPVSNLTSISTEPQQIAVAVYKQWETHKSLLTAGGFTVSVPHVEQLEGVWKLGAKYSHYPYSDNTDKIVASGLSIDHGVCDYGPILSDGIGWAACQIVEKLDFGGNHGLYIGQIAHVHFNPTYLNPDGTPRGDVRPVMQITGNAFTTASDTHTVPYYTQSAT